MPHRVCLSDRRPVISGIAELDVNEHYQAARGTVARVLRKLAEDGLVVVRPGSSHSSSPPSQGGYLDRA